MGFKHRFRWLHDSIRLRYLRLKQKSRPEKNLLGRDKEIHEYPDTIALEGSFSRFNELPAEIRLIIWELALPEPRVVTLKLKALKASPFIRSGRIWSKWPTASILPPKYIKHFASESLDITGGESYIEHPDRFNLSNLSGFHSNATPPAILYVCHESFDVASNFYTKSFAAFCALPTIWFDFKRDTLLLDGTLSDGRCDAFYLDDDENNFLENIIPRISLKEIFKVENLALGMGAAADLTDTLYMWLIWTMSVFEGLKSLTYELPGTRASPGPWLNADGEVEYFPKLRFERYFQDYKEDYDRSGRKRERQFAEDWVMPVIVERCISEL